MQLKIAHNFQTLFSIRTTQVKSLSNLKSLDKKINQDKTYVANLKNFPPENPSFFFKASSFGLVVGVIHPSIQIFMHGLNKTNIYGRENIKDLKPGWILASNHITILDDLFLGPVVMKPLFF